MQHYSEESARRRLVSNGIGLKGNTITLSRSNVGIKLWGAIDYLCHYHDYMYINSKSEDTNE